jgi:hypothetical protein
MFIAKDGELFETFDEVLVRDHKDDLWRPAFFSHYLGDKFDFPFAVIGTAETPGANYRFCLPYEENKDLAFTKWENVKQAHAKGNPVRRCQCGKDILPDASDYQFEKDTRTLRDYYERREVEADIEEQVAVMLRKIADGIDDNAGDDYIAQSADIPAHIVQKIINILRGYTERRGNI